MSIFILQVLLFILAVTGYLFLFWRRLKEDYVVEPIFSSALIILATTLIAGFSFTFLPYDQTWFWGACLGYFVSLQFVVNKYKFRFFELYEASSRALFVLLGYSYLSHWLINRSSYSLYGFLLILALFVLFAIFERNYRKFTWYKSGKIGFSGLMTIGIFFLVRALLGMFEIPMISLVGKLEFILSGIASFMHFFFVYNLSES